MDSTRRVNVPVAIRIPDHLRQTWLQVKYVFQCVLLDAVAVAVVLVLNSAHIQQAIGAIPRIAVHTITGHIAVGTLYQP